MSKITREDLLKLARLSALELKDEELDHLQSEVEAIMAVLDDMKNIEVGDVQPTIQVNPELSNVMRNDETQPQANTEDLLKNVPEQVDGQIKVPKIL